MKPEDLIAEQDRLSGTRATFEQHWQECADFCLPRKADFTSKSRSPGEKRNQKLFDSTAIWANEQLASGLHGMLTSPAVRWFFLRSRRKNLSREGRAWLEDATNRMYAVFASSVSNFDPQMHEFYLDEGCFGTAVMFIGKHNRPMRGPWFNTRHLGECFIGEDHRGLVDSMNRKFEWTAVQAVKQWGEDAVGPIIAKMAREKPQDKLTFLHVVKPRQEYNSRLKDGKNKPWASVYLCVDHATVISESGFDRFPYLASRWTKATNEIYGRSPAMNALADIKMLNEMSKTTIKAAQKIVDPPLQVPDDGFLGPTRTVPGGLNYYRSGTTDRIEPIKTGGDVKLGLEMENQRREAILRAFHVDWMNMPSQKGQGGDNTYMTAQEALMRRDEKMRMLGPMLSRQKVELLSPLIEQTFAIMMEDGMFADIPEDLFGEDLEIEFVSPIHKAQKSQEAEGIFRLLELVNVLAPYDPSVPLIIDGRELAAYAGEELYSVPTRVLRSREAVAELVKQQQEQQANAEAISTGLNMATIMKDGAKAMKDVRPQ